MRASPTIYSSRLTNGSLLRGASLTHPILGLFPVLTVVASVGVALVAIGYTAGRLLLPIAPALFWLGMLIITVPILVRMLAHAAGRTERLSLILLMSMALFLVKVLHSPLDFTLFDEFHHWRTVDDIVATGRLFSPNNILPASPYYPGLEIVTVALVQLGLPLFVAGSAVVAAAKVLISLALFHLFEEAGASPRLAGLASVLYMANPGYLFFDAQFSYESLALPFAAAALFGLARLQNGRLTAGMMIIAVLSIAAVVVTHHLTSYFLAAILLIWGLTSFIRHNEHRWVPMVAAIGTIVATLLWLVTVAPVTIEYLVPIVTGAAGEVLAVLGGGAPIRELFRPAPSEAAALWEQLLGFGSVIVVALSVPVGVFVLLRRRGSNAIAVSLAMVSLAFGASLLGRFTERGGEIAGRSSEFIFVGAAYVVALVVLLKLVDQGHRRWGMLSGTIVLLIVLFGGFVLALPPWARIPGRYLVSADTRSIEPQAIEAAEWMLERLGPGNRILTDRTNRVLLTTYGRQHAISAAGDHINVRAVFFARQLGPNEIQRLRETSVPYAVIDERLSTSLPFVGVYAERGELATTGPHRQPMDRAALTKYDGQAGVDRVFDSGDIQVYDMSQAISDEP